ncbi:hypothetical protein [Streptomyces candidus]|uniref:Uncharacterized protein n=1 Tax=Streptomyces candidus TaxID=67283 RepID=A0A7X0HFL4_9ACTN|nr:hypothetical protein [Streptomyces candidus]MBB6436715.1 hypothetical protein [Streptomyces candidus]GHH51178.1 hypothetical protein GCM10018773_49280 [Streptomyces candidus]
MTVSTTITPGTTSAEQTAQQLALLTARTGLEPELAQRYTTSPLSVLAEFGLAAEPVYVEMSARPQGVSFEQLDDSPGDTALFTNFTHASTDALFTNFTHAPSTTSFTNFTHAPSSTSFTNFTHAVPAAAQLS